MPVPCNCSRALIVSGGYVTSRLVRVALAPAAMPCQSGGCCGGGMSAAAAAATAIVAGGCFFGWPDGASYPVYPCVTLSALICRRENGPLPRVHCW